jgi:hypothetical protein
MMALSCGLCGRIVKGAAIPRQCPGCGMTDLTEWTRLDDVIEAAGHDRDRAFLESRRAP